MKKSSLLIAIAVFALTSNVWAGNDHAIITAGEKNKVTVAQALNAPDETAVSLTGHIVRQIKAEYYELKDSSGTITIEVDKKLATTAQLKQGTHVRVIGEVDTHKYKPKDIDVVKIEIIQ